MTLSQEQLAIKEFSFKSDKSLTVSSSAGVGKTSTLLKCIIPGLIEKGLDYEDIVVLMFNKAIQLEFAEKAVNSGMFNLKVSTFHAFGYGLLSSYFQTRMDKDKLKKIGVTLGIKNYETFKLVNLAKIEGVDIVEGNSGFGFWNNLAQLYSIDLSSEEIRQAQQVFAASIKDKKTCDFADMLYLPVFYDLKARTTKALLIDEAQDTGALRLEFLKRVFPNTRLFAVGDPNQCIFSFAGSDENAMSNIQDHFKAENLPLLTSWRCSRAVTKVANYIVPEMRCRPDAPEGKVCEINEYEFKKLKLKDDVFILCRLNAPLLPLLFSLLQRGYNCRIHGRDIGEELISIFKKWKWTTFRELEKKLETYIEKKKSKMLPENRRAFAAIQDKIEVLKHIVKKCIQVGGKGATDLAPFIRAIFKDEGTETIVLSTIHRLKGREARDVYIWGPDEHCARWLKQDWEFREEERVKFVGITRAKENLIFVMLSEGGKKENPYLTNSLSKTEEDDLEITSAFDKMAF